MWVVVVWAVVVACMAPVSVSQLTGVEYTVPTNVTIAGLFPLTGSLASGGVEREAAFRLGVELINSRSDLLPQTKILYRVYDTQTTASGGMLAALAASSEPGLVGIIGAASSSVSRAVQQVASVFKIPQISYSSTASSLSDKTLYPYFSRVVAPDSLQGSAMASILFNIGWRTVATLYSNDDYGFSGVSAFSLRASQLGMSIPVSLAFSPGVSDFGEALAKIRDSGARVIFLNCLSTDASNVLRDANRLGMLKGEYVWVGTDGWLQDEVLNIGLPSENLVGILGLRPSISNGPLYEEFLDRWEALNATNYAGAGDRTINVYGPFSYDALFALAHALHTMIVNEQDVQSGDLLQAAVANTSFAGITGQVAFDSNYDRVATYSLINYRGGAQFDRVGEWRESLGLNVSTPLLFYGNVTMPPYLPLLSSAPATSSTLSTGIIVLLALLSLVVIVLLGVVSILHLRRRKHVAALEQQNEQLNREALALNTRLNELSKVSSKGAAKVELPITQVTELLLELRDSMPNESKRQQLEDAITSIQANMLFTPSNITLVNTDASDDVAVTEFVKGTLLQGHHEPADTEGLHTKTSSAHLAESSVVGEQPLTLSLPPEIKTELSRIRTLNFDLHAVAAMDPNPVTTVFMAACTNQSLFRPLGLDANKMREFILALEALIPKHNAFHNPVRAAASTQFVHYLLSSSGLYSLLGSAEALALLLVPVIKHVDHPGLNNAYLTRSRHKLAILHSNTAVLERHHLSVAMNLAFTQHRVFHDMGPAKARAMHQLLVNLVLATDMSRHTEISSRFSLVLDPTAPALRHEWKRAVETDPSFRDLVLMMVAKLADLSDVARPRKYTVDAALRAMVEHAKQGNLEAANGLSVSPFMDGTTDSVIKSQKAIIRFVALPLFSSFAEVFTIDDAIQNIHHNGDYWAAIDSSELTDTYTTISSKYAPLNYSSLYPTTDGTNGIPTASSSAVMQAKTT